MYRRTVHRHTGRKYMTMDSLLYSLKKNRQTSTQMLFTHQRRKNSVLSREAKLLSLSRGRSNRQCLSCALFVHFLPLIRLLKQFSSDREGIQQTEDTAYKHYPRKIDLSPKEKPKRTTAGEIVFILDKRFLLSFLQRTQ